MNKENKGGASASPTASGGGSNSRPSIPREEKELITLREEIQMIKGKLERMKPRIYRENIKWCSECRAVWINSLYKECPDCESRDFKETGWIEQFDTSSLSRGKPAAGGAPRRGAVGGEA